MPDRLYNILVPVDFTSKNKWAIAKAIELANNFGCTIHLVHVIHKNILPFVPVDVSEITPYESHPERMHSYEKLKQLAVHYSSQLCAGSKIEISVLEGNPGRRMLRSIFGEVFPETSLGTSDLGK